MIWIVEDLVVVTAATYLGLVVAESSQTARRLAQAQWPDCADGRPKLTRLTYARRDQLTHVMEDPLALARAAARNAGLNVLLGIDEIAVPRQALLDTLDAIGARYDSPGTWEGVARQVVQDRDAALEEVGCVYDQVLSGELQAP